MEGEKSVEMVSKAATDSREIVGRFITPTLLTLPSPCFPVNARQIHAREHPYTSLRPSTPPPPLPFLPLPLSISGLIPQLMNFNGPQSETPQQCFSISQSNGLEPPESS